MNIVTVGLLYSRPIYTVSLLYSFLLYSRPTSYNIIIYIHQLIDENNAQTYSTKTNEKRMCASTGVIHTFLISALLNCSFYLSINAKASLQ